MRHGAGPDIAATTRDESYDLEVAVVVLTTEEQGLHVLLLKEGDHSWALPTGPVLPGEDLGDAALRLLEAEADIVAPPELSQLITVLPFTAAARKRIRVTFMATVWYPLALHLRHPPVVSSPWPLNLIASGEVIVSDEDR